MRILQCIKASGNRSIAGAAVIGLLMSIAVALIVVNRLDSRVSAQSDSASTKADTSSTFAVYAPYWSVEDGFVSTIEMKNYRVDKSLTITPVLYPLHGSAVVLDPVALNPSESRLLNINDALAAHHKHFTVGAVEIKYTDVTESVFGANLTVLNTEKSLIYDFQFRMPEMSSRLEGVWWFYDEHTDGFIAVHNTSDDVVTATPIFYAQQHPHQLEPLHLQPHEMRLIELRKELNKLELGETIGGGIRIESSKSNVVIAGGGLVNPEIGFSAPLRMDDPEMQAMRTTRLGKTLHALMVSIGEDSSMMGMGLPPGTLMNPIVNLRNVTDGNFSIKLVFRYQVGNSTRSFTMPPMQLGAQEVRRLNLLPYWQSGQIPQSISSGSVELSYTGKPGSLVAGVTSVDQTGTFVFDAKIDNRLAAGFQGEYWSTEGDNNTAITIKNITQKEAKAWPSFQYDSGRSNYEMQALTLQPGESQMIDLKMLQMERVLGVNGVILPDTATFGGMKLREEPGGRHFLIDAVVFNPKTATCGVCGYGCLYPRSLAYSASAYIIPLTFAGDYLLINAIMCDGTHQSGWECTCGFSSDDGSVATVDSSCQARGTGMAGGDTQFVATAIDVPGPACGDQTLYAYCPVTVQVPTSLSLSIGALQNHNGDSIRDCQGTTLVSVAYGYSRNLTYTVLDQKGKPIKKSGMTATEDVTKVASNPSNIGGNSHATTTTASNGTFCDVQSLYTITSPAPPSGSYIKSKQVITITLNSNTYTVRINCLDQEYNDVTITDVTSTPDATCQ